MTSEEKREHEKKAVWKQKLFAVPVKCIAIQKKTKKKSGK